jgi:hypothetical protein
LRALDATEADPLPDVLHKTSTARAHHPGQQRP